MSDAEPNEQRRTRDASRDPRRRALGQLLVLLGLSGFAIAQPLLDVLGNNPTVFTFTRVEGFALVWLALALALIPPLVLWGVGRAITAIDRRAGFVAHVATVGVLAALVMVQVLKWQIGLTQPAALVALSLVAAAAFTYAYARFQAVGEWTRYTAVLPAFAVALFVFASPSSDLLRGPQSVAAGNGGEDLPPVVVILLDEFPTKTLLDADDEIDEIRFPNIAAFSEDATWYRNFTTLAPFSNQAVPAILTGTEPGLVDPLWTEYPNNLFSLLAPSHNLSVFESFTKLCGSTKCVEGPPGEARATSPKYGELSRTVTDLWVERVSPAADDIEAFDDFEEETVALPRIEGEDLGFLPSGEDIAIRPKRHEEFLDSLVPTDDPTLYYLHLVLPHNPFRFYPDGTAYNPVFDSSGSYPGFADNNIGPWASAFSEQRHIYQAEYTDALVGEIMATLEETGIYDEALVVVLSDHGASFETDTPFRHLSDESVDSLAYSPLLVKPPGQTDGSIDDSNLMGFDVLPTMADIMGIEIPWRVDGAPAGSDAIAERGDAKHIMDLGGTMGTGITFRGVVDFEDRFPTADDRWIPPARPDDYPLAGLLRPLGFDDLHGRSLDEIADGTSGEVTVKTLDTILRPGPGATTGWVEGLIDAPNDAVVLVEVNGELITGSRLYGSNESERFFAALLPSGVLEEENEIRVGVMIDGTVTERTVVG